MAGKIIVFLMASAAVACADASAIPLAGPGAETEREIQACVATGNTREQCCENHALASCPEPAHDPAVIFWNE